jgi:hypothetical protein
MIDTEQIIDQLEAETEPQAVHYLCERRDRSSKYERRAVGFWHRQKGCRIHQPGAPGCDMPIPGGPWPKP